MTSADLRAGVLPTTDWSVLRARPTVSDVDAVPIVVEVLSYASESDVADRRWHATAQGVTPVQWTVTLGRLTPAQWGVIAQVRATWAAAESGAAAAQRLPLVGPAVTPCERRALVGDMRQRGMAYCQARAESGLPSGTFARYWRAS